MANPKVVSNTNNTSRLRRSANGAKINTTYSCSAIWYFLSCAVPRPRLALQEGCRLKKPTLFCQRVPDKSCRPLFVLPDFLWTGSDAAPRCTAAGWSIRSRKKKKSSNRLSEKKKKLMINNTSRIRFHIIKIENRPPVRLWERARRSKLLSF